jgi:hypothetical protein
MKTASIKFCDELISFSFSVRHIGLVVNALDSRRETQVQIYALPYRPIHNILGQGVNLQVPQPTKPFIPPGSMN